MSPVTAALPWVLMETRQQRAEASTIERNFPQQCNSSIRVKVSETQTFRVRRELWTCWVVLHRRQLVPVFTVPPGHEEVMALDKSQEFSVLRPSRTVHIGIHQLPRRARGHGKAPEWAATMRKKRNFGSWVALHQQERVARRGIQHTCAEEIRGDLCNVAASR